jgi:hypothetical protein
MAIPLRLPSWLPVTRKIATINIDNDYINPGSEKEKEIYETYLAEIKEENGIVKLPIRDYFIREGFLSYNLKTGETRKIPLSK